MKYTLINLHDNTSITYANEQELAVAWANINRHNYRIFDPNDNKAFVKLNMNGNDSVWSCTNLAGYQPKHYTRIYSLSRDMVVRQYMVKDEQGRIVDIRQWSDEVWSFLKNMKGNFPFYHLESKPEQVANLFFASKPKFNRHAVRAQGIKQRKLFNDIRDAMKDLYSEDIDLDGVSIPNIHHRKFVLDAHFRSFPEKNWKRQSKSRKQWGKHGGTHGDYVATQKNLRAFVDEQTFGCDNSPINVMDDIDWNWCEDYTDDVPHA